MSETEKKPPLFTVVDNWNFNEAAKKLLATRKVSEEGRVISYEEITHKMMDKILKLRGVNVSYEEIHKQANNKCKTCNGKGYYVKNLLKSKFPNPNGYLVLEDLIPDNLSEEQQKIWKAKIEALPTWRIFTNCTCAVMKYLKKNLDVIVNDNHNIFVRIDYDIVPATESAPENKDTKEESKTEAAIKENSTQE